MICTDIAVQWCMARPAPTPHTMGLTGHELYERIILGKRPVPDRGLFSTAFGDDIWLNGMVEQIVKGPSVLLSVLGPLPPRDEPLPKHFLPMTTTYRWPAGDVYDYPDAWEW